MSLEEYLLLAIGAILLFILYYVTSRDAQMVRQTRSIASALEELHRQFYHLEKRMNARIEEIADSVPDVDEARLRQELERRLRDLAGPIGQSLQEIEESFGQFKDDMDKRLHHVEDGVRHLTMPSSVSGLDDAKILALYQQGIDLDTIARELRLSKAEVEFVLKLNKMR